MTTQNAEVSCNPSLTHHGHHAPYQVAGRDAKGGQDMHGRRTCVSLLA
jgi:hypothetical protein